MIRRTLPIGIQSFQVIRDSGCYYVDKTDLVRKLVDEGRNYFLSRPRRFGKSLLVDTLKELFEGNEPLFEGLAIHDHWDWSVHYPVVRLSFDVNYNETGDLQRNIASQLERIESDNGLDSATERRGPDRLQDILHGLHRASGQRVVVLVDEYDKPILDVIDQPEMAIANRQYLRGLYGAIKGSANDVRFVFVTGVSMFTKTSLFSEMNNLDNISLDPEFAAICGYTDNDLDTVFAPELPGLDRDEVRRWYNGYNWLGEEKLYNPYDLLLLFRKREFMSHWFETGSPSFLVKAMMERGASLMDLENRSADARQLSRFDIENIDMDALLFQTGYLTIRERVRDGHLTFYTLDYPNFEVRQSLSEYLLNYLGQQTGRVSVTGRKLSSLLAANDFEGFAEHLKSFLGGIPYQWKAGNGPARYEAWYAGMLYACFSMIGLDFRAEESSGQGRSDMVVFHGGQVFVLEFKAVEDEAGAGEALDGAIAQIRERGYGEKYRSRGEPVHLMGLVFGGPKRSLVAVRAERM